MCAARLSAAGRAWLLQRACEVGANGGSLARIFGSTWIRRSLAAVQGVVSAAASGLRGLPPRGCSRRAPRAEAGRASGAAAGRVELSWAMQAVSYDPHMSRRMSNLRGMGVWGSNPSRGSAPRPAHKQIFTSPKSTFCPITRQVGGHCNRSSGRCLMRRAGRAERAVSIEARRETSETP